MRSDASKRRKTTAPGTRDLVRIVLASAKRWVRQSIKALLEAEREFRVVGEALGPRGLAALVERVRPDAAILDLTAEGPAGVRGIAGIKGPWPATRVIVLAERASEADVLEALRGGVSAVVLLRSGGGELVRAVHEAVAGRRYLSSPLADRAIEAYLNRGRGFEGDSFGRLTPREAEVLRLVAQGWTSPRIAHQLRISSRTVETHRAHAVGKLGVRGQAGALQYALVRGLLGPHGSVGPLLPGRFEPPARPRSRAPREGARTAPRPVDTRRPDSR